MRALRWSWWVGDTGERRGALDAEYANRLAKQFEAQKRLDEYRAQIAAERIEREALIATFQCPKCCGPLSHTDENDYICDRHGFVSPVDPDGNVYSGDGRSGPLRVIGHRGDEHPLSFAYHSWLVGRRGGW